MGRKSMRTAKLGSNGPDISVVGFGAWEAGGMAWGPNPSDEQTIKAMTTGVDKGMTWIDTAEVYGDGRSEELVAGAIKGRDDVLVFTKVASEPAGSGLHAAGVRAGAEGSLKRLGRDVIDLYQIHWPDRSGKVEVEETWEAMQRLVDDGLVRWIGVSNFNRDLIERCEKIRHVDSLQPHFSMLHRDGRDDLFSFCESNGTGIICYGPLGFGLLTGAFSKDTVFGDDDWRSGKHGIRAYDELFAPGRIEKNLEIVEALRPIADRLDVTQAQLALAWALHQRGVTGAIAGSRSPSHVADNAEAGTITLEDKDLEEIEKILTSSG
jgi:aryl-alcohol dehydrogenase-like predicted oxidoreductase